MQPVAAPLPFSSGSGVPSWYEDLGDNGPFVLAAAGGVLGYVVGSDVRGALSGAVGGWLLGVVLSLRQGAW